MGFRFEMGSGGGETLADFEFGSGTEWALSRSVNFEWRHGRMEHEKKIKYESILSTHFEICYRCSI